MLHSVCVCNNNLERKKTRGVRPNVSQSTGLVQGCLLRRRGFVGHGEDGRDEGRPGTAI